MVYIGDLIIPAFWVFPYSEYAKLGDTMTNAQDKYILFLLNNLRAPLEEPVISKLNNQENFRRAEKNIRKICASSPLVSVLGFYGMIVYFVITPTIL
ncbi:MAG TPA: hypothetical protein VEY70_15335 [Metabacillus sp.]|nr:hypothetical protein [Metabacillus sp.]